MNRLFAEFVSHHTPKFNADIVNGLACRYIPMAQEFLDGIYKSGDKSFPKELTYDGMERCTPHEEYLEATRLKGNKRTIDLAESDIYLVRIKLSYVDDDGVKHKLPDRHAYLPFVNDAGTFRLGGPMYHITGVLSNKVISPGPNSIFVRLLRDRLMFKQTSHSVMVNNERETFNMVWSGIYRSPSKERVSKSKATNRAVTSVAHYLFAKYGVLETFKRYAGFTPKVGVWDPSVGNKKDVVICRSSYLGTQAHPSTYIGYQYLPSKLYLEIPTKHWNATTAALVAGFFYTVDHFPDRFPIDAQTQVGSQFLWMVLLGHVIFQGLYSEAVLYDRIREHFESLDDYLDILVKEKLKEIGWNMETFYDLIARIMSDFPNLLLGNQIDVNSMYGKTIEILYYALEENIFKVFTLIYQLRKIKSKKALTFKTVGDTVNKILTPRAVFNLQKNQQISEGVSYCGDHKYPKLTSKLTEQESGAGNKRGRKSGKSGKSKRQTLTEANHLHASMAEGGSLLFLSKSDPMPNRRINPYAMVELSTSTIVPRPEFAEAITNLQNMLVYNHLVDTDSEEDITDPDSMEDDDNENETEESEFEEGETPTETDVDDEGD